MSAFLVCDACGLEAHTPGYRPRGWDTAWSKESVPSSMDQIVFDSAPSDDLAFDFCPVCKIQAKKTGSFQPVQPNGHPLITWSKFEGTPTFELQFGKTSAERVARAVFYWSSLLLNLYFAHMFFRWLES